MPTLKGLKDGSSVLFVAHEHVLRGMIQGLQGLPNDDMLTIKLPNAAPFVFEFSPKDVDQEVFKPTKSYFIEDEDTLVHESTRSRKKDMSKL